MCSSIALESNKSKEAFCVTLCALQHWQSCYFNGLYTRVHCTF